jgi:exosortase
MPRRTSTLGALTVVLLAFAALYWGTLTELVGAWSDENFSHGYVIVPIALYFAWERRAKLAEEPPRPSWTGLFIVVASVVLQVVGVLAAALFVCHLSILSTIAGVVVCLFGWRHLRILAFPIAFLVLMIPIPTIIFNQIAFPLQLLASRFGELGLNLVGVPVLREGNVITLSNTTLEVADACSGIRSLISLLTLAIVYGYLLERRTWARIAIAMASVPVAVATNGFRVAATGVAAHYIGPEVAQGVLHEFSGWLVFVVAFIILAGVQRAIAWLFPDRNRPEKQGAV